MSLGLNDFQLDFFRRLNFLGGIFGDSLHVNRDPFAPGLQLSGINREVFREAIAGYLEKKVSSWIDQSFGRSWF